MIIYIYYIYCLPFSFRTAASRFLLGTCIARRNFTSPRSSLVVLQTRAQNPCAHAERRTQEQRFAAPPAQKSHMQNELQPLQSQHSSVVDKLSQLKCETIHLVQGLWVLNVHQRREGIVHHGQASGAPLSGAANAPEVTLLASSLRSGKCIDRMLR